MQTSTCHPLRNTCGVRSGRGLGYLYTSNKVWFNVSVLCVVGVDLNSYNNIYFDNLNRSIFVILSFDNHWCKDLNSLTIVAMKINHIYLPGMDYPFLKVIIMLFIFSFTKFHKNNCAGYGISLWLILDTKYRCSKKKKYRSSKRTLWGPKWSQLNTLILLFFWL